MDEGTRQKCLEFRRCLRELLETEMALTKKGVRVEYEIAEDRSATGEITAIDISRVRFYQQAEVLQLGEKGDGELSLR